MLTVGELFAGIGGFSLGLEATGGFKTIWQSEIDPYAQRVLARHWPDARQLGDITRVDWAGVERVDVLCGPCQDISNAGPRLGMAGTRSGLWSEFVRAIRLLGPRWVLFENVSAILGRGMARVLGDLARSGYDAEWRVIHAADFGAWHQRERLWLLAYPMRQRIQRPLLTGDFGEARQRWTSGQANLPDWSEDWSQTAFRAGESRALVSGNGDVVPDWAHRVKALGNAIVPQIATWIGQRILEYEAKS